MKDESEGNVRCRRAKSRPNKSPEVVSDDNETPLDDDDEVDPGNEKAPTSVRTDTF
jgi:hypothetical protein